MKTLVKATLPRLNPFERNWLFFLSAFLFIFIPLYPKFPLVDILPGYIVRIRFEDFLVLFTAMLYIGLWFLKKVNPLKNPLFWPAVIYLIIGLLSGLSAIFITKTIPLSGLHIGKWFLHWARRIEYLFFLFLFFDSVKTKKQFFSIMWLISFVVVAAAVYGFGQKYAQWPVYSTMNREFAKGWRLVLTEHARVPSTFAGHYDLAAFLVLTLPLSVAMIFYSRNYWVKTVGWSMFISGYTLLILTASRSSFLALLVSWLGLTGVSMFILGWKKVVLPFGIMGVFATLVFLTFGDLSGRFAQLINLSKARGYIENDVFHLDTKTPRQYLMVSDQLALVADKTDVPPIRVRDAFNVPGGETDKESTSSAPPDVFEEIPDIFVSTDSSGVTTISTKPRQYSDAAFTYGLSSAIRFDALWPRALAGFKRNPLLGSGYSTLLKTQVTDFTEAESTDNDYLRALGETGLLGFIAFFGIIFYAIIIFWRAQLREPSLIGRGILLASISGIFGLLINALYIDVFEASKVAFTFWAIIGLALAYIQKISPEGAK